MKEDKERTGFGAAGFEVLIICLLAIAVFIAVDNNNKRLECLEEKIQVRDSIILRMQDAQERQDSVMFDYLDKWIYRLSNND